MNIINKKASLYTKVDDTTIINIHPKTIADNVLLDETSDITVLDKIQVFVGATESEDGNSGIVPMPEINDKEYYLKGDGTWSKIKKDAIITNDEENIDIDELVENGFVIITDAGLKDVTIIITPPVIVSPVDNSKISIRNITIASNTEFSYVSVLTLTHVASDYKITSDINGNDIVLEINNSSDLKSHTFEDVDINSGIYYCFMRYVDNEGNKSDWSEPVTFIYSGQGIISESGRLFYRHSSDMGTVMEYKDSTGFKKLLILDRDYRGSYTWGTYNINTPLTDFKVGGYLPLTDNLTDDELMAYTTTDYIASGGTTKGTTNYTYIEDENTAKQNCDLLMTYQGNPDLYTTPIVGVPAVEFCRSITVNGIPCDLPNVQQIARIYLDRNIIESLDPSTQTRYYKLTGVGTWWWTSTEHSTTFGNGINGEGRFYYGTKATARAICPVLELN